MSIEISVVVPTYRRPDRLRRLVNALVRQTLPTQLWELIVVDDCSPSGLDAKTALEGGEAPPNMRTLRTPENGGPAAARNVGWRAARTELLAFCDDDVVPDPDWLANGLAVLRSHERAGVIQGRTSAPEGTDLSRLPEWTMFRVVEEPSPTFEACNIYYRRAALEAVGGFDEEVRWWGEDTTCAWKVIERGWQRGWAPKAHAVHDLDFRGARWFVRNSWNERHLVLLAARHPGFRAEAFWRPWASRRQDAAFALAVLSGTAALWFRPAALGALPYLWLGRPSMRRPQRARRCFETVLVDAGRLTGHLVGSAEHGILVI